MNNSDWGMERWRILLVLFLSLIGGMVTGYWLISLTICLLAYIGWLLFKLNQLSTWLTNGARASLLPDNNGIWERITQQVQLITKKSDKRKKRMANVMKRLQGIITGLPYATVVLNDNNEIDWANALSNEYLNIDIKTDRGQRVDNLIRLPEVSKVLENDYKGEIEFNISSGDYGIQRQLALQVIRVEGDLKLLIARDISDRINTNRMRKNFIANASHELRTPLTVIAGYLEIMQEDETFPDNLRTAIASAADQSSRMQNIIEDLLTLSRLESLELNDETVNIINMPAILNSVTADENALIMDESHTIRNEIDSTLKIKGSEVDLISVCSNLIHNAVRHTQDGTTVIVKWYLNASGEACLEVNDDGQGIPEKHLAHLTERFYRVDKGRSRDKGGTGLGLAIVQHIAQCHGASMDIHSEMSKGTTFSICFPKSCTLID